MIQNESDNTLCGFYGFISHLSALWNHDTNLRLVVGAHRNVLYLSHDEKAVNDTPEDHVFPVQEFALGTRDEELTTVGILAWKKHTVMIQSLDIQNPEKLGSGIKMMWYLIGLSTVPTWTKRPKSGPLFNKPFQLD